MMRPLLPLLLCWTWLAAGCGTPYHEAALVLEDLAAGSGPSRLKTTTPQPRRTAVAYQVEGRHYRGDRYTPGEAPLAGIVLIPGAQPDGRDDPRLVDFAMTLARIRFTVLVPDLPGLRSLQIGAGDIQGVRDAFVQLAAGAPDATRLPTGFGAFSYAAGPTILAAMGPQIRDRVDFVLAVGGYHDLERVITFFTTGYHQVDGAWRHLAPNAYGQWVFVYSNLDRLADPADRETFRRITRRRLADTKAPIGDLVRTLGPEGRALHDLLDNADPARTPALIARLPAAIRADIDALNLANKDLGALKARLILVHGRDDNVIPFTESLALAARLPAQQVDLFVVDALAHVDLKPGLVQSWRLWRAVRTMLRRRAPGD
jgi:pimeloyl-ACP methyl ester carboxylesterase